MSSHHNLFKVNHTAMLRKIGSNDPALIQALIDAIAEQNGWSDATGAEKEFLRKAGRNLIIEGDLDCDNAGWIYYGLMLLDESEQIGDGWKAGFTEEILEFIETTSLSESTKNLFRGLLRGRDINFNMTALPNNDVVACFISAEEAARMNDELDACDEFKDMPDPEMEQIIFNEFSAILDPGTLTLDQCFFIVSL